MQILYMELDLLGFVNVFFVGFKVHLCYLYEFFIVLFGGLEEHMR